MRLWPIVRREHAQYKAAVTRRYMSSQQDGIDSRRSVSDRGLKHDDGLSLASLSVHVRSPQEMEEMGAFFGEDSQEGDVVLLSG